jgi:ABC-type Fe3+/spermidine/putrescine transport system ATPase subunit
MFQDFALFPHLDVAGNVRFGLRMQHLPADQQRQRAQDVLELVGLSGFERRDVARLSGGERQRVALARSLAPNPRLLMLDEPLGSLDAALRERLAVEVRVIIKRVGLTALYVTHDQQEVFAIADRVAVMNAGQIEQVDRPETVYRRPETTFVARFLGLNNVLPVVRWEGERAQTAIGDFHLNERAEAILLHPDGLSLTTEPTPNGLTGQIEECVFLGDSYRIGVRVGNGTALTMKAPAFSGRTPEIGDQVNIQVRPEAVVPLHE